MGLWTITEFSKTSPNPACEPPLDPFTTSLAIVSQSGNNLTMMFAFDPADPTLGGADGGVFTGTITSGAVSLAGSHPDDTGDGTETLNLTATVAASCNALTGSATFTFRPASPSAPSCTGTTRFSGTRTVGSGCTGTITNTPVAEDVVAPHATVQTAQPVGLGSVITGSVPASDFIADEIGALANADFYTFNITATTPVTAMLTSLQDSDLHILDSAGTTIAESATDATNEAVAISLSAGTYYVVVQPYSVTTTTGYTLVIQ